MKGIQASYPYEMLKILENHFRKKGYRTKRYSEQFGKVRIPLYCIKDQEEIIIEYTTSLEIKKSIFFPDFEEKGINIKEGSPLRFFQYYFPKAKIYFAYLCGSNIEEGIEKVCQKRGIGMLEVSEGESIKEKISAYPVINILTKEVTHLLKDYITKDERFPKSIAKKMDEVTHEFLRYLVYYPKPIYTRRNLIKREEEFENISMRLIEKMLELKSIKYSDQLKELAKDYQLKECRDDYELAMDTVKTLWKAEIGVDYPEIQKKLEDVLLLKPTYREHFLHQFQVFLLGACLIDELRNNNEKVLKNDDLIENIWLVASTYHDFSYSIQKYNEWTLNFFKETLMLDINEEKNGKIDGHPGPLKLENMFVRQNFLLKTKALWENLGCDMNKETVRFFYEKAILERNHGLLSALSLLKLFDGKEHKLKLEDIYHAASAIAIHDDKIWGCLCGKEICNICKYKDTNNCTKWEKVFADREGVMENCEFEMNPIAFLLIFCDTVQEWGRIGRDYERIKAKLKSIRFIYKDNNIQNYCKKNFSSGVTITGKPLIEVIISVEDEFDKISHGISKVSKFLKDPRFVIKLEDSLQKQKPKITAMWGF